MSTITSHVLDTERGRPAAAVPVRLEMQSADQSWKTLAKALTDSDGRVKDLLPMDAQLALGTYRIIFDTAAYFFSQNTPGFYPEVAVVFVVRNPGERYHIPLLLSPYGYSTYRGS